MYIFCGFDGNGKVLVNAKIGATKTIELSPAQYDTLNEMGLTIGSLFYIDAFGELKVVNGDSSKTDSESVSGRTLVFGKIDGNVVEFQDGDSTKTITVDDEQKKIINDLKLSKGDEFMIGEDGHWFIKAKSVKETDKGNDVTVSVKTKTGSSPAPGITINLNYL